MLSAGGPDPLEAPCSPGLGYSPTVDLEKLEYRTGTISGGFPSFLGLEAGRESYSNFLASTVEEFGPGRGRLLTRPIAALVCRRRMHGSL